MPDFTVIYYLAGDFANVAAGENVTGAKDIFTQTFMSGSNTFGGDALNVAATATVHGGDDSITMGGFYAYAGGDAINSDGSVIGGDDTIRVVNSSDTQGSYAAGDVIFVDAGSVTGGDDKITFINPNIFTYVDAISGDVRNSLAGTTITGGDDTITMTGEDSNGGLMAGDVFQATCKHCHRRQGRALGNCRHRYHKRRCLFPRQQHGDGRRRQDQRRRRGRRAQWRGCLAYDGHDQCRWQGYDQWRHGQ